MNITEKGLKELDFYKLQKSEKTIFYNPPIKYTRIEYKWDDGEMYEFDESPEIIIEKVIRQEGDKKPQATWRFFGYKIKTIEQVKKIVELFGESWG